MNPEHAITQAALGARACYGNGLFVGVGEWGTILTSADGDNWLQRQSGTRNLLAGITYGDGLFVAVSSAETILTSADGVNWTQRQSGMTGHDYERS